MNKLLSTGARTKLQLGRCRHKKFR